MGQLPPIFNGDQTKLEVFSDQLRAYFHLNHQVPAFQSYLTTVPGGVCHSVHWRLTSEPLAKWPKSRQENGQNMLILRFSCFGCLFQFLNVISVDKHPPSNG